MSNQSDRDRVRAYMREHDVNYTTARRAVRASPLTQLSVRETTRVRFHKPRSLPVGVRVSYSETPQEVDLRVHPHLLITDRDGQGKARSVADLLKWVVTKHRTVDAVLISGAHTQPAPVAPNVAELTYTGTGAWLERVVAALDGVSDEVHRRQRLQQEHGCESHWQLVGVPQEVGLTAPLLFIVVEDADELLRAGIDPGANKLRDRIRTALEHIARAGREVGVSLVVTARRADSAELAGLVALLVNILALGRFSETDLVAITVGDPTDPRMRFFKPHGKSEWPTSPTEGWFHGGEAGDALPIRLGSCRVP